MHGTGSLPPRLDLALGGALLALGLTDVLTQGDYDGGRARLVVAVVLQTAPLAWRRTHTLLAVALSFLGVVVEVAGQAPYGGIYGLVGFLLLVHATARWAGPGHQGYAVGALLAGLVAHTLGERPDGPLGGFADLVMPVAMGAVAWAVGSWGRAREAQEEDLEARHRRAVEEERSRISRDLHDVVGHALAGISLTAGAAEQQPGARDEEIASALRQIGSLSRSAAADVRLLVGMLREDADSADGARPTLEALPALVEQARGSGQRVDLVVTGDPVAAPAALQLAVYRVVQEGLTNAARHAPGAAPTVTVSRHPDRLEVSVVHGPGTGPGERSSGGLGLVGLRERIEIHGGDLVAEPTPDGGFLVRAGLPIR